MNFTNFPFSFIDFSFNAWLESKGENVGEQLSSAGKDALIDILGLSDLLLSPPCDRKRSPYSPSLNGWNNCKLFKSELFTFCSVFMLLSVIFFTLSNVIELLFPSHQFIGLTLFSITVCPLSFVNLPTLPSAVSCSVPEYCTGINCCLDIEQIGLSIKAYIDVNMCNYIISGGIETQTFKFSLFNYEWGKFYTLKRVFQKFDLGNGLTQKRV